MADHAEFIVVCIDNSREAYVRKTHEAQFAAVKLYCKTKLAANRETEIILVTMGSSGLRSMLRATSDYKEIRRYLSSISLGAGLLWFDSSLSFATPIFCRCPPNKQKRMLFLVGGLVDINDMEAVKFGSRLKGLGIAVDVVNFYLGKRPKNSYISNQYGRKELEAFVGAAKFNDNSCIEHIAPQSFTPQVLFKSILRQTPHLYKKTNHHKKVKGKNRFIIRKTPRLSRKTNNHKKAKGENHAAGDNEHFQTEALSLENEVVKLGKRKAKAISAV